MLLIRCPWCGPRPETDFTYGGEAHIARPARPEALSDEAWGEYLFFRANPKGAHREQWCHAAGCRRWFNAVRDTVTYAMGEVYKPGEPAPPAIGEADPDPGGAARPTTGGPPAPGGAEGAT